VSVPATTEAPTSSPTSISSLTTPPSTGTPSSTTGPPATGVESAAAFVTDLIRRDQFSGVVLIASDDEVVFQAAGGLADRESNIANCMGTRFNLGSMNKMFTAVAILQLMEGQLLALDGTVAEYLPDYPNPEVAEQVTIRQLLTHTSGLGDVFTEDFEAHPHQFRANADYLPLFVDAPLQFSPGGQFSYSNAGYVVLGLIIERLTGLSYDDYVHEHIFQPSGMLATGSLDVEEEAADLAIGYTTRDLQGNETGVLTANTPLMPGRGFAAGGGYSTAGDLLRFRNGLFGHQLLSPASLDLLITGQVEVREHIWYAFGFFDRVQADRRVVGHTGSAPGVCSFMDMYPESGYTVVVLSNSDGDCATVLEHLGDHPLP
jgi:D-alanyl-D-alanine carboxypeptidase